MIIKFGGLLKSYGIQTHVGHHVLLCLHSFPLFFFRAPRNFFISNSKYSMSQTFQKIHSSSSTYLFKYFGCLALLFSLAAFIFLPYSFIWLFSSGDVSIEKVVKRQAENEFILFGSGISQDFADYKLQLYAVKKPAIVAIGSSRVMQFRGSWFKEPFLNMGGAAGNIGMLNLVISTMLKISHPAVVIIGIDFWWFLPQWEANPEEQISLLPTSYNYGTANLIKPWSWLWEGKISIKEFFAPVLGLFGAGFRADRFGILAQQTDEGFGPDGSWYYTAEISGEKPPYDYQFQDTLMQIDKGIKAFFHATDNQKSPAKEHLEKFAEICCKLKSRGIATYIVIPPLSAKVYDKIKDKNQFYPHLFKLSQELKDMGLDVLDFSDPRLFSSSDCEFIDGFHGGEVTYARILRYMADRWPKLHPFVAMDKLNILIKTWQGNAMVPDIRINNMPEIDFMNFKCTKHTLTSQQSN